MITFKRAMLFTLFAVLTSFLLSGCTEEDVPTQADLRDRAFVSDPIPDLPLEDINLPQGFKIDVFASVNNARSITMSPSQTIFVGNRSGDKVYAIKDLDGDWKADRTYIIDENLRMPNGVAFKDGDLYVATVSQILRYRAIEENLENPPSPEVIYDDYPTDGHHGWKYIAFGPDGLLYVPVGAPCNICERPDKPIYASITRIDVSDPDPEIFAHGVRNTVGFTWDPSSGDMWFTDNGRDMLGDNSPPCELNKASAVGSHYGYPFCHGGNIADPEFGDRRSCDEFVAPAQNLGPHVAPLGLKFYSGSQFPNQYHGDLFIAEHGSWNRSQKIGYRVMQVAVEGGNATGYENFAYGWLNDNTQTSWGRPVDVLMMPDGSMLVSDDYANVIYRISYDG